MSTLRNWNDSDSKKLYDYFNNGDLDPNNTSNDYIKQVFEDSVASTWLNEFTTLKRFLKNYRRHVRIWKDEINCAGKRRGNSK